MRTHQVMLIITVLYMLIIPMSSQAATYEEGTTFTLEIDVELRSGTGWYSGYTEDEHEIRKYEILSVDDTTVSWQYHRDYELDANENEFDESDDSTYTFKTDKNTREYLNGTHDGATDANYYKAFDKIWFRIHPEDLEVGNQVKILGSYYTYEGMEAIRLSPFKGVEAMKLTTTNQRYTVSDTDYDPDDYELEVVYDETFYFHPDNGYLLKSKWEAKGITDFRGTFEWEEEIVLTQSSFVVDNDFSALVASYLLWIILITVLSGLVGIIIAGFRNSWKRQVDRAIERISGTREFRGGKLPISNIESMDYTLLLDDFSPKVRDKLMMEHGVYIVVETDNRLVIADTNNERKLNSLMFQQEPTLLRLFYRLALGRIHPGSKEASMLNAQGKVSRHIQSGDPDAIGFVDQQALSMYMSSVNFQDGMYHEIAVLLARRKVLDYSHGQAPLSPQSHMKKAQMILELDPREVLLIGDDDLISITLARRGVRVTLLEIDPYTLALIQGITIQENLPIKIDQVDLRQPLPRGYQDKFDLFVADPDFSIESFALFLSRGLSSLRLTGIGLINFEDSFAQRFRANYLLEKLNITVMEVKDEKWRYTIIRNKKIPIRGYVHGKYTIVRYDDDLVLEEATYSSKTFMIKKELGSAVPISPNKAMDGDQNSIYDY